MADALFAAIRQRQLSEIESILKSRDTSILSEREKGSVDFVDYQLEDKWNPIHLACEIGDSDIVKLILNVSLDCLKQDTKNYHLTPLSIVCTKGNLSLYTLLKEQGASVSGSDTDGRSLLHWAAFGGNTEIVKDLVQNQGLSVTAVDEQNGTPFHMAAFSGNVELLQFLYDTDKSVLCLKDNDGWTAMHRAAARNKVPAMKFLRELGLELEEKNRFGLTPLSLACVNGSPDAVDYLLNEGCSTNVQNNYSETPLHHAAKSDNKKAKERVIELLMKANATANVKDWYGKYPHEHLRGDLRRRLTLYWKTERLAPLLSLGKSRPDTLKAYVIGNSRAGKTTFVRVLTSQGGPVDVQELTAGIEVSELCFSGCRLKIYDLSGREPYLKTHGFFISGSSVIIIYVADTECSESQLEKDAIDWLTLAFSSRNLDQPSTLLMIILGSRGEEEQQLKQAKLSDLVTRIKERYQNFSSFVFLGEPMAMDLRKIQTEKMNVIKEQLLSGAQHCLNLLPDVPSVFQNIVDTTLPQLRLEKGGNAGVRGSDQFLEKTDFQTLVGVASDALKEPNVFELLLEHLEKSGEITCIGNRVFVDPPSLSRSVLSPVAVSTAQDNSDEFPVAIEAKPDGTASLDDIARALDRSRKLYGTTTVDPVIATDILCHMNLSLPLTDGLVFPALIEEGKPDTVWVMKEAASHHTKGTVYVGIRLQCPWKTAAFSPSAMTILQCEMGKKREEMQVVMWRGGMQIAKVSPSTLEALVQVAEQSRCIHSIDVIVRGPPNSHRDVKLFLDEIEAIIRKVLGGIHPGIYIEKAHLSHTHISHHVDRPAAYSRRELDAEKWRSGEMVRETEYGTVHDRLTDMLAVSDDHIILLPCDVRYTVCNRLDQSEDDDSDWEKVGRLMGIPRGELESVKSSGSDSLSGEMLDRWGRHAYASVRELKSALRSARLYDVLRVLEK